MPGRVVSVNVGKVQTVRHEGKPLRTAVDKRPIDGAADVEPLSVGGDEQADHRYHGGPDRALYAYAGEDYDWWSEGVGRALAPGLFGENLTLRGVDVSGALIGERWRVGSSVVQVTAPRTPCSRLAYVMNDPHFVKAFGVALRPGAYLRVVETGRVAAGDPVEVIARPNHELSVARLADIFLFDRAGIPAALAVPDLPDFMREWALEHQR